MPSLLRARGLYTYYNELSTIPEGALVEADDVVIDRNGIINPRRGFSSYGTDLPNPNDRAKQVLVYKDRILRHFDTTLQFDSDAAGTFSSFSGTFSELETGLRIKAAEASGNLFFTTSMGVQKISADSASDFTTATDYITTAGGVKALDVQGAANFATSGFLTKQSKVAYRIVWGINDLNGNLILGSPSSRTIVTNNSDDTNVFEKTSIDTSTTGLAIPAVLGDGSNYFLINNALDTSQYFVWYDDATTPSTEPVTAETVGRIGVRVGISGLTTTAEVAAATATELDNLSDFSATVVSSVVTVTNAVGGNATDAADSVNAANQTGFTITTSEQGSVTAGKSATVDLTFTVPSEVNNTNHFYQVYRTGVVQTSVGVTIDDLEPGDEMNLVLEAQITSAEITAGEVTVNDITPEDFRASGALLYTNPLGGEGILQANEKPPVSKDLALFRESMFYANTSTIHRKTINMLSVSGFVSGTSDIIIGNNTATRTYTFIGVAEISTVLCDTFAATTDAGYFLLNSASNEQKYFVWFDKTGTTTEPSAADTVGRLPIRVNISADTSAIDVATTLASVLDGFNDFGAVNGGTATVTITNIKNGNTDDLVVGLTSPGGGYAFAVSTQGDGENSAANEVLLSSLVSAGQSIDETARSLVNIINRDSSGIVYAYYLSGPDSLPGIILLENRTLDDVKFFVGTSDSAIDDKFNPVLPVTKTITTITAANPTQITSTTHDLATDDEIYIFGTDSTPALLGDFIITKVDNDNFTVPVNVTGAGTAGTFFSTSVASDNEVSPNRVYFSKSNQPEAVPLVNFFDVGSKDEPIKRIVALRDNLFVFKTSGIFIITGVAAPDFTNRLLDNSANIIAADSAAVLNNQIYALTAQGIIKVSDTGVEVVSRRIEDKILEVTNPNFTFDTTSFGVAYESDRSYLLWLPTEKADTFATQCYRYNTFSDTFTRWVISANCGVVNEDDNKLYLGSSTDNVVLKERKNNERQDNADEEFSLSFPADAINGTTLELSSVANVSVGDALVQIQYLTVSRFNRLLKKLDSDPGLTDTNYFSTLGIAQGANLVPVLTSFVAKLSADDSGETYVYSGTADFLTIQTEVNVMIGQLNGAPSDTLFKDYSTIDDAIEFEVVVLSVDSSTNTVVVNFDIPFLEGPVISYENIDTLTQWAPQHFGDPSIFKQVREGTFLFDGNDFYSASVAYNTDLSQNFEEIPFFGQGIGLWGGDEYSSNVWGGQGSDIPFRTLIPEAKQRCRYISCQFKHKNARETFNLLGISLVVRPYSTRAYN